MLTESAAIKEPTKKMAFVVSKMGFLPKMSETLPHIGVAAEFAMRYAEPTQVYPEAELNFSAMVGKAVVTMVMSRATSRTAMQRESMIRAIFSLLLCGRPSSTWASTCAAEPLPCVASLLLSVFSIAVEDRYGLFPAIWVELELLADESLAPRTLSVAGSALGDVDRDADAMSLVACDVVADISKWMRGARLNIPFKRACHTKLHVVFVQKLMR